MATVGIIPAAIKRAPWAALQAAFHIIMAVRGTHAAPKARPGGVIGDITTTMVKHVKYVRPAHGVIIQSIHVLRDIFARAGHTTPDGKVITTHTNVRTDTRLARAHQPPVNAIGHVHAHARNPRAPRA